MGVRHPTPVRPKAIRALRPALLRAVIMGRAVDLDAAAHATLARAVTAEEAITDERLRLAALARVAKVQSKVANAALGPFVPLLSIAPALPDRRARALALQEIAASEADASLGDEAAHLFTEAVGLVSQDGATLGGIAAAQRRAGLIQDAAATFEQALTASMAGEARSKQFKLTPIILSDRRQRPRKRDDSGLAVAAHSTARSRRGHHRGTRSGRDTVHHCTIAPGLTPGRLDWRTANEPAKMRHVSQITVTVILSSSYSSYAFRPTPSNVLGSSACFNAALLGPAPASSTSA